MTNYTLVRSWRRTAAIHIKDGSVLDRAAKQGEADAYTAIRERVLKLNPNADEKKIRKFAYGR